jgi:hypothetical protein
MKIKVLLLWNDPDFIKQKKNFHFPYYGVVQFLNDEKRQGWSVALTDVVQDKEGIPLWSMEFLFPERVPSEFVQIDRGFLIVENGPIAQGIIINLNYESP